MIITQSVWEELKLQGCLLPNFFISHCWTDHDTAPVVPSIMHQLAIAPPILCGLTCCALSKTPDAAQREIQIQTWVFLKDSLINPLNDLFLVATTSDALDGIGKNLLLVLSSVLLSQFKLFFPIQPESIVQQIFYMLTLQSINELLLVLHGTTQSVIACDIHHCLCHYLHPRGELWDEGNKWGSDTQLNKLTRQARRLLVCTTTALKFLHSIPSKPHFVEATRALDSCTPSTWYLLATNPPVAASLANAGSGTISPLHLKRPTLCVRHRKRFPTAWSFVFYNVSYLHDVNTQYTSWISHLGLALAQAHHITHTPHAKNLFGSQSFPIYLVPSCFVFGLGPVEQDGFGFGYVGQNVESTTLTLKVSSKDEILVLKRCSYF